MIAYLPHHAGDKLPAVYVESTTPVFHPSDVVIIPMFTVPPHDPTVNNGCSEWNSDTDPLVERDNQGAPCEYDVP